MRTRFIHKRLFCALEVGTFFNKLYCKTCFGNQKPHQGLTRMGKKQCLSQATRQVWISYSYLPTLRAFDIVLLDITGTEQLDSDRDNDHKADDCDNGQEYNVALGPFHGGRVSVQLGIGIKAQILPNTFLSNGFSCVGFILRPTMGYLESHLCYTRIVRSCDLHTCVCYSPLRLMNTWVGFCPPGFREMNLFALTCKTFIIWMYQHSAPTVKYTAMWIWKYMVFRTCHYESLPSARLQENKKYMRQIE